MPNEYRDETHIVAKLKRNRRKIENWFGRHEDSLEKIVRESVGGNTFRAFRKMPRRPSVVFRNWAIRELHDEQTTNQLYNVRSQRAFDKWHHEFCSSLRHEWEQQMGEVLPFGASRKLPDLLLKAFVRWAGLHDERRKRLIDVIHVSLDSLSLAGIRNCIDDPEIPADASMRFVAGPTMYRQIQEVIRGVANKADTPAIYYDVLVWNIGR